MPPGVSHASKTGQPDAIPVANPVIPPPRIHVLAPRLVKFVVLISQIHCARINQPLLEPHTGLRMLPPSIVASKLPKPIPHQR